MAIKLLVHGNNLETTEHKDILGRTLPNQHPIISITGLEDALDELRNLTSMINQHQSLGNREKDDQHPLEAITGLIPLIELFLRDLTGILIIDSNNILVKQVEYQNVQVYDDYYYIAPSDTALESYVDYNLYPSVINAAIVNEYRTITNSAFKLYIAKTLTNWLDILKPLDDATKLISIDNTVSNVGGVYHPWWSYTYLDKALIYYEFTFPFYINRIAICLAGVGYYIRITDYRDIVTTMPELSQDISDGATQVTILNQWVKKLEIIITDFVNPTVTQEYNFSYLAIITKDEFVGKIIYKLDMGVVYSNPSAIEVLNNTLVNSSISKLYYNSSTKLVELAIEFAAYTQTPIHMQAVKLSYHHAIGETFQDIYKRLITAETTLSDYEVLFNSISETLQMLYSYDLDSIASQALYAYNNVADAVQITNPETNQEYASLNARFEYIEGTHFAKYVEVLNQELTNSGNQDKHDFIVINSQITDISLSFEYPMGTHRLKVYLDGVRLEHGADADYTETSPTTIAFNYPIEPTLQIDGTYKDRELIVEYLCLNPSVNLVADGQHVIEYHPKLFEVITQISVPKLSSVTVAVPIRINQCNIKHIIVTPNREAQYIVIINDIQPAEFPVYKSRIIRNQLYESVDLIYRDKLQTCAMYITINNIYNYDTDFEIEIRGIELDSAGGMDEAYNRLLMDSLNALSLNKLLTLEQALNHLEGRINITDGNNNDITETMATFLQEFSEIRTLVNDLSELVSDFITDLYKINNFVRLALYQIQQIEIELNERMEQINLAYIEEGLSARVAAIEEEIQALRQALSEYIADTPP